MHHSLRCKTQQSQACLGASRGDSHMGCRGAGAMRKRPDARAGHACVIPTTTAIGIGEQSRLLPPGKHT
eukprot:1141137-Pelagomonas_calceolata.AAC.1